MVKTMSVSVTKVLTHAAQRVFLLLLWKLKTKEVVRFMQKLPDLKTRGFGSKPWRADLF